MGLIRGMKSNDRASFQSPAELPIFRVYLYLVWRVSSKILPMGKIVLCRSGVFFRFGDLCLY